MRFPVCKGTATLTVLTISLIIAGCASTGGIAPQAQGLDATSLDAGAAIRAANADAAWPAADWWRAYQDPQLDAWVDAALAGNPTLAVAEARVRDAQAMAGVAAAALAPQIKGDLSMQRQHWPDNIYYGPGSLANANTWNNTGTLGLSYHLDLWGRDRNAAERALDAAHARAADARAARLELETNVVRAYVDLSMNYALLDIARATLAQQQKVLAYAERRLKGGIGTQLEVTQAQTPLPEYERQIDALDEAIALGQNQLAALAGKGPGAGETIMRPKLALTAPAGLPSALPADLIGHRPDVVAARWTVAAQARGIDVAKADFYPNINLLASLGGFAAAGPMLQFLHAANGGWTAGPALSLPIFDGGRLRSQLGAASAGYDAAVDQYNQTLVTALRQIADEVVRIRSLATQKTSAERSVAVAQRNYDLSVEGYRRGLTDYLNVLTAQTQLLRAQEGVARIQAAQLTARASLVAALGGGLADPADGPLQADALPAHGRDASLLPHMPAALDVNRAPAVTVPTAGSGSTVGTGTIPETSRATVPAPSTTPRPAP
ncbi:efflux transporter outer membrane subunit [Paraburkholderia kururiensis]|uniref:efflux transporter outer membrane subunit n=1 Tax=Paraburkholderia kururiensis TaxID=984307 RepID=UPI0020D10C77|nr:efflux transporter outer membrane subunit [Paraburkholderia kururiensis]